MAEFVCQIEILSTGELRAVIDFNVPKSMISVRLGSQTGHTGSTMAVSPRRTHTRLHRRQLTLDECRVPAAAASAFAFQVLLFSK